MHARLLVPVTPLLLVPVVVSGLRARGAVFPDVPSEIDRLLAQPESVSALDLRSLYPTLKRFYFDPADDRQRDEAFRARLAMSRTGTSP